MAKTINDMTYDEIHDVLVQRQLDAMPTVGDLRKALVGLVDTAPIEIRVVLPDGREVGNMLTHIVVEEGDIILICDEDHFEEGLMNPEGAAMYKAWKGAANG